LGCDETKKEIAAAQSPSNAPASAAPAAAATPIEPVGPALHVDAARAMQYTKAIVAFGPRWDSSPTIEKVRAYIKGKLKGDQVEEDAFVADTSAGQMPMKNIIAKFPGSKDGIIIVGSHYETNYWLRNTPFVGANDGAATSALLLAIADQLRGKKATASGSPFLMAKNHSPGNGIPMTRSGAAAIWQRSCRMTVPAKK
jgi:Zn-dependent M28 family amino/carboxypeptidase